MEHTRAGTVLLIAWGLIETAFTLMWIGIGLTVVWRVWGP
jgi:hypothetical protein